MPSIEGKYLRCLVAAAVVALSGCHYTEEQKWGQCCNAVIVNDERSNTPAAKRIIDLQRHSHFNGEGRAFKSSIDTSNETSKDTTRPVRRRQICRRQSTRSRSRLFHQPGHDLHACNETRRRRDGVRDRAACMDRVLLAERLFPGRASHPEELQKPIAAVLYWRVNLSESTVLDNLTRLSPTPGGRLCHR